MQAAIVLKSQTRFVGAKPKSFVDPSGDKSWGIHFGGSFTFGPLKIDLPSITLKIARNDCYSCSTKGSYSASLQTSVGGITRFGDKTQSGYSTGVAGIHGSIGATLKVSNADHVTQLSGKSLSHGGSLGKGVDISASIATSIIKTDNSIQKKYSGVSISEFSYGIGGGIGAEGHTDLETNNTPNILLLK